MRRTIDVFLAEPPIRIGTLRYDRQGARESATFEYSGDWLASSESFAIGPELRLITGPQFHKKSRDGSVFHDPIADTEPDGWAKNLVVRDFKTWIAEDTGPEATVDALLSVAPYFRLSTERARAIVAEVESVVGHWRDVGSSLGMTSHELDGFEAAFEHDERRAAQRFAPAR